MLDHNSHSVPADHVREKYVNRGWIPISKDSGGNLSFLDELSGLQELELYDLSINDYVPLFPSRNLTRMTCSFNLFKTFKQEWKHNVNLPSAAR